MESNKALFKELVGMLWLVNVISFLIYYLTTYVIEGAVAAYFFYFYTEIVRIIIPIASAVAVLVTFAASSVPKCLLLTLYCTLPWLIYLLPYNAYKYAYGGLVIEDVIYYALIETAFVLFMLYLLTLFLTLIMATAAYFFMRTKKMPFKRSAILSGSDPLDFSTPSAIGIFAGCIPLFLYNLIKEIVYTVDFIGYADGVYETGEIIYMVIKYVFILGMLLLSYFTAHKLKKILN